MDDRLENEGELERHASMLFNFASFSYSTYNFFMFPQIVTAIK